MRYIVISPWGVPGKMDDLTSQDIEADSPVEAAQKVAGGDGLTATLFGPSPRVWNVRDDDANVVVMVVEVG